MDISSLTPEQLENTPFMPNPTGAPPNFIDPPSRSDAGAIAISVMLGVTLLILFARIWTRAMVVKQFGLDDWLIIPGGVVMIAVYILVIEIFYYGAIGRHGWDVRLSKVLAPFYGHSLYTLQIVSPFVAFFAKASIFAFLHRVFPRNIRPWTSIAIWAGFAFNLLTIVVITLVYGIICAPHTVGSLSTPRCANSTQIDLGQVTAAVFLFLDLYILAIAVPSLWSLQMTLKRRIGAILVMSVGLAATVCSILTLYFRVVNNPNEDGTWNQIPPIVIATYEGMVAIATACLPAFPALWTNLQENVFPSLRQLLSNMSRTSSFTQTSHGEHGNTDIELHRRSEGSTSQFGDTKVNMNYGAESTEAHETRVQV